MRSAVLVNDKAPREALSAQLRDGAKDEVGDRLSPDSVERDLAGRRSIVLIADSASSAIKNVIARHVTGSGPS